MTERSFMRLVVRDGTETKERVEQAAIRLFSRRGIAETSIRQIAKEAGVAQGSMYSHFVSKEELAWTLFSRYWSEMGVELRRRLREHGSLRQQLRAMTRYIFELYEENPDLVKFIYFSRHDHLRRVSARLPNPYLVFKVAIVEAMARGEIPRQNAEAMTALMTGMLIQMIDSKALGRIRPDLPALADLVSDRCYRVVSA